MELIEIGAAVGLILGIAVGGIALGQARARTRRAEAALRAASGAFMEVLEERFGDWSLTPAERDVALFAIKGMSTQEIAALRETSGGHGEGTDGRNLPESRRERPSAASEPLHR